MAYSSISLELVSPLSQTSTTTPTPQADPIQQVPIPEPPDGGYNGWLQKEGLENTPENLKKYAGEYKPWCNENGELGVDINLPMPDGESPGELKASYGELSSPTKKSSEHNESKAVSDAESLDLGVSIVGNLSASWEGPVIAEDGSTVSPPPPLSVNGAVISWGVKVTGTLRLSYTEEHLSYTLKLTPREDLPEGADKEDAYKSTLYLTDAEGKTTAKEIDLPDMSGGCPGDASFSSAGEGESEGCVRHNVLVDPCTGEVIREWDEAIPCPEEAQSGANS